MTKSDLETGMRVKLRNGLYYMVMKDVETENYGHQDILFINNAPSFMPGSKYTEDLKYSDDNYSVEIVYKKPGENNLLNFDKNTDVLWERTDEPLQIIKNYGVMNQLKHFNSEVFELNEAIICYENNENDFFNYEKKYIAEELADVQVMLNQFKEYYCISEIEIGNIMQEKIERQIKRIEGGE